MRQLCPLVLVDGPSIADPQREVDDAADGNVVVRVAVDGQHVARVGAHDDAVGGNVKVLHGGGHPVDVVMLFVQILGQHNTQAWVQRRERGLQRLVVAQLAVCEVILVVVVVSRDFSQQALVTVAKEDLRCVLTDDGRSPLCARHEGRGALGAIEDILHVQGSGLVVSRPSLVPTTNFLTDEAVALCAHGLVHAQLLQLVAQDLVATTVDAMQM